MDQGQIGKLIDAALPGVPPDPRLSDRMTAALATLTPRESKVLELRLGLQDGHRRTLEQVARELKVTRERIRQIEMNALRKLRTPTRSRDPKNHPK